MRWKVFCVLTLSFVAACSSVFPLKDLPRDREIVTYCACPKDQSSISAAQIIQAGGFTRVRVLQGGWHEWLKANGPVQPK